MQSTGQLTPVRWAVLLALVAVVAPAIKVATMAAGLPFGWAGLVTALACAVAGWGIAVHLPATVVGSVAGRRILLLVWLGLAAFAAYRIAGLGVFMYDVERSDYAFNPTIRELADPDFAKPFYPTHNCFTCYIVGAHLASTRVENLYDKKYYRRAEVKTPIHQQIGDSLHVDSYQYPPPFLILPRLLMTTGGDFHQLRAYWFGLNVVVITATVVMLLLWIGPSRLGARWLALPILLVSPITLATLQIENVHLLIIAISLLSLPAFEKGRHSLGGALLGFAIVSKLFPVLLLAFLLLRKRWRAVCWTGGWMIAYGVGALLMFGPRPFNAFLSFQMPRLASGEAFAFATTNLAPMVKNSSILGVAYKLEELGLIPNAASVANVLEWAYAAVLVAVVLFVGLRWRNVTANNDAGAGRTDRRLTMTRIWLVLLILGQLRSPFLPWGYGNITVLLLLMFLLPVRLERAAAIWKAALLIPAWAILSTIIPLPFGPPTAVVDLIHTLAGQAVVLVCCAAVVIVRPPGVDRRDNREAE